MDRSRSKTGLVGTLRKQINDLQSQLTQQSNRSLALPDWLYIGDPNQPAFQNGAVNSDPTEVTNSRTGFWKDSSGIVHLIGAVTPGPGFTTTMFTLPVGFRPRKQVQYTIAYGASIATMTIKIGADGTVALVGSTSQGAAHVDGVHFRADQ